MIKKIISSALIASISLVIFQNAFGATYNSTNKSAYEKNKASIQQSYVTGKTN